MTHSRPYCELVQAFLFTLESGFRASGFGYVDAKLCCDFFATKVKHYAAKNFHRTPDQWISKCMLEVQLFQLPGMLSK